MKQYSKKWLASDSWLTRIVGASINNRWWIVTLLVLLMALLSLSTVFNFQNCHWMNTETWQTIQTFARSRGFKLLLLTLFSILVWNVCNTLTNIYTLLKNENGITWCQIFILLAIGVWIIGVISIFGLFMEEKGRVAFGLFGGLLVWIFQDKVKGAVAFIHLRLHHLLKIDDWIQVPNYNVDGEVKRISLTTVTVYNWDTTTSTIPISTLHSDHFINLQNMSDGKTYGRQMQKSFIIDTKQFHVLSKEEAEQLNLRFESNGTHFYLPKEEIHEGVLNAHLYRLYLYHWLMNHPRISQQPRLVVRWMEQKEEGLPLQVYAYIIDSNLSAFEWQQSQIFEHIIESLDWFGLQLYQRPSSYDISGIQLTEICNNRKEPEQ